MSVKHSSLVAALMLGTAVVALDVPGPARAADGEAPVVQFGAGAPSISTVSPIKAAPKPIASAPWVLDRPKPQEAAQPDATSASGPNLGALRFYAQQNDLARVAAEIRLLRAKFPGWEPPTDLFTETQDTESDQPLWDLFAKHDLDGLKTAMDERRQRVPGWQPSADLALKIELADAYDGLVRASDAKDFGTVVDIAANSRGLMTCANIDAIWRTAEALVRTDDEPHAVEAYRYILATCPKPQERLATVQKAALLVSAPEALDGLMRMGRRLPNGTNEFADLRLDAVRQRIGDAAAGKTSVQPNAADLDQIAMKAHGADGCADAELLGWYVLSKKDFTGAETWFRTALQPGPSSKAAEGLVLALRDGGKMPEAIKLAPQYAALGPLNRKLMMEVLVASLADAKEPLPATQLGELGAAIDAEKSADAAQSLGWSLFKTNDLPGAEAWFHKSIAWQPNEAAAVGLMVTAKRLKHQADYAAVVTQYQATYPRVASLDAVMKSADRPARPVRQTRHEGRRVRFTRSHDNWDQSATAIVQTFQAGQVDQALAMMDARRANRAEPKGLAVVRGWALFKKGDVETARQVFTGLKGGAMSEEADKGLWQIQRSSLPPILR